MDSGRGPQAADVWDLFDFSWSPKEGGLRIALSRILDRCAAWFDASTGSVFLKAEDGDYLIAAKTGNGNRTPDGVRITRGMGIAGLTIEAGLPLLVMNPSENPLLAGKIARRNAEISSAIVVPLMDLDAGCIGVMNLARENPKPPFTQEDLRHVASVVRQISLAVSNVRLFDGMRLAMLEARGARQKLEGALRSLGVAVIVIDAEGRVTNMNPRAGEFLGVRARPYADWSKLLEKAPEALASSIADAMRRRIVTGESMRIRGHEKTSGRSWSLVSAPMPDGGTSLSIEEVTEHERYVAELSRVTRLAEIGQMSATIAHEIRNPLAGISMAAQMLTEGPEYVEEFAGIIQSEVRKLNELCEGFLDFARPLTLREKETDLAQIVEEQMRLFRPRYQEKGVRLEKRVEQAPVPFVGDADRIAQVLVNLLQNSLQACSQGDRVIVRLWKGGFSVEDTGSGMSEKALENLFTPFFTTKPDGTGLGMCHVRKVVDAHGGHVEVWSQAGKGSRIAVDFESRIAA